ncbi:MAG: hypothetical protein RSF89_04480 [Oscillospiraceae bacterium]
MFRTVKWAVDGITAKQVDDFVNSPACQILHCDINCCGVIVNVCGQHLHFDAVILIGFYAMYQNCAAEGEIIFMSWWGLFQQLNRHGQREHNANRYKCNNGFEE